MNSVARLVILEGGSTGESVALGPGETVLGRDAAADVVLRNPSVSRRHCVITPSGASFEVADLGTTNGTRVNGRRVSSARLADGDEISAGGSVLLFIDEAESSNAVVLEGHTRLADAGPAPKWRAAQLDDLLTLGEELAGANDAREVLSVFASWLETTLFVARVQVKRRTGARWVTVLETGAIALDRDTEAEVRRSAGNGEIRWIEALGLLFAPLSSGARPHVAIAQIEAGDPHPTEWELRLTACASRLVRASLGSVVRRSASPALPRLDATQSDAMREAVDLLDRVAETDATVLLRGESGTGKELAARWLHERGARVHQPFVAVNCGALAETLLESELFGHETGAFTGAISRHPGRFERAHGGTLFLDEIGELSPGAQARLLRVLETRMVERVGGTEPFAVDVRIVAATHRDLEAMCASGEFRQDLYYRLAVLTVRLPALRERAEDIPRLAQSFLAEATEEQGRPLTGFDADAQERLTRHRWPGNIRELRNAIAHACVVAAGPMVGEDDLPPLLQDVRPPAGTLLPASLREVEEAAVRAALDSAEGNKSKAARILGINRATLYAKLELYAID